MIRAARALYFTVLGVWAGGMATLAFIVAPTLFRSAPSRAIAGSLFGSVLRSFGTLELVLGLLAVAAVLLLWWKADLSPKGGTVRIVVLSLMIGLSALSGFHLGPAIERERASIPNFESVPARVPARARFDSLHAWSVRVGALTLLLGVGLLAGSAATLKPRPDGP